MLKRFFENKSKKVIFFSLFITMVIIILSFLGYDYFIHSPYKGERLKRVVASYLHISSSYKHKKIVKIPSLRKQIVDANNNTLARAIRVYKLSLANDVMSKKEFSLLIDRLSKIIFIDQYVKHYYSDEYKNASKLPFKIIAYGISKEDIPKIKSVLQNSYHLHKKAYRFNLSGEKIFYPYKNLLTPYMGYTKKILIGNYTYRKGVNGLQGYYNKELSSIASKNAKKKKLTLNISINLEKNLEHELDVLKKQKHLQEVIALIINPKNYHIKAIASSNRYNANKILNKDCPDLEIHAILYLFKIGDFIKPIPIKDYRAFGLYKKSGIDLLYERTFNNKSLNDDAKDFKVNFIQLVKMYAVFYNGGKIGKPTIAQTNAPSSLKQIISKKYADAMKAKLPQFFDKMKNKIFLIEKEDNSEIAHIYMKEITIGNKKYLKAYFMIGK